MRKAFFIGLGIGAALGVCWMVTMLSLAGRVSVYRDWHFVSPILAMLLLIAGIAAAVVAFRLLDE